MRVTPSTSARNPCSRKWQPTSCKACRIPSRFRLSSCFCKTQPLSCARDGWEKPKGGGVQGSGQHAPVRFQSDYSHGPCWAVSI